MSRSDLLSDVLAAIRNAALVRHDNLRVPYSAFVMNVLDLLKREGYIVDCVKEEEEKKSWIVVSLKYDGKKSVIRHMERVSKPSRRVYLNKSDIKPVLRGKGLSIVTTSKGVMTDKEARQAQVGGEVVLKIW
jgi:small subunit ribosomal protein S8